MLPPRTGKTVIAAHITTLSGLHAAFIVPTRVLVYQTRAELARHAPGLAVGAHFGEHKETVPAGLNLTTYASLQRHSTSWSPHLAAARLVFVDEAHHALTAERKLALMEAFPSDALMVALTATPDYDARRRLQDTFPHRIARLELRDALRGGLLAPARVHVAEVDVDGSVVHLVAGEYQPDQLGRLLSTGPFLQAALTWRYDSPHARDACMIACVTRQQAVDVGAWLTRRRPKGRPPPAVILGETPPEARRRQLEDFEAGRLDTIVQVGVLIEGWTSLRCKLLIDLAPGRSRVRATQKYFRALTRDGDTIANLVVLIPTGLRRPPVLPMELLLDPGDTWAAGQVIGGRRAADPRVDEPPAIRGVRLLQRLVISAPFGLPRLDPADVDGLREVLISCFGFGKGPVPLRATFEATYASHPSFSGTGAMLLRWLGVPRTGWYAWVARMFPGALTERLLGAPEEGAGVELLPWDEETAALAADLGHLTTPPTPEQALLKAEALRSAVAATDPVKPRWKRMLRAWCGLDGEERGLGSIAEAEGLSRERVRQVIRGALIGCRDRLLEQELKVLEGRGRDEVAIAALWSDGHVSEDHPWLLSARERRCRGDLTGALATARHLIRLNAKDVGAHELVVEVLIGLGREDALVRHVRDAWRIVGDHLVVFAVGRLLRAGHAAAVLELLQHGLQFDSWLHAHALLLLGREAEAWAVTEAAGESPSPELRYERALLRHRAGRPAGGALLGALATNLSLAEDLVGHGERAYAQIAAATWRATPDAIALLQRWMAAPEVRAFVLDFGRAEIADRKRVWQGAAGVVRAMGGA